MLAEYTPIQQSFLLRAYWEGVPLDAPIATAARTNKLEMFGLIHKRQSKKGGWAWRVTDSGRSVVCAHSPKLLALRSQYAYTHQPWRAMKNEPEAA
jgi:hypothetical protein